MSCLFLVFFIHFSGVWLLSSSFPLTSGFKGEMEKEQAEGWKEQSQLSCPLRWERRALIIFLCWLQRQTIFWRMEALSEDETCSFRVMIRLVIVNTVATIFRCFTKLPHLWSRQCRMTLSKQDIYTKHILPKAIFPQRHGLSNWKDPEFFTVPLAFYHISIQLQGSLGK